MNVGVLPAISSGVRWPFQVSTEPTARTPLLSRPSVKPVNGVPPQARCSSIPPCSQRVLWSSRAQVSIGPTLTPARCRSARSGLVGQRPCGLHAPGLFPYASIAEASEGALDPTCQDPADGPTLSSAKEPTTSTPEPTGRHCSPEGHSRIARVLETSSPAPKQDYMKGL